MAENKSDRDRMNTDTNVDRGSSGSSGVSSGSGGMSGGSRSVHDSKGSTRPDEKMGSESDFEKNRGRRSPNEEDEDISE